MANVVFSTEISNVSADLSSAALIDDTNYTNQGVARNALSVVAFLYKRDASNNDVNLPITNANPLTATSWTFTLPSQDGLFIAELLGFPIWGAGTYPLNSAVYYGGSLYYVNNVAGTSQVPGG